MYIGKEHGRIYSFGYTEYEDRLPVVKEDGEPAVLLTEYENDRIFLKHEEFQQLEALLSSGKNWEMQLESGARIVVSPDWTMTQSNTSVCVKAEYSHGDGLFGNFPVRRLVLEEGISIIPKGCFEYVRSLVSVSFPKSLAFIDKGAFNESYNLAEFTIPENIQYIHQRAFSLSLRHIYPCAGLDRFLEERKQKADKGRFPDSYELEAGSRVYRVLKTTEDWPEYLTEDVRQILRDKPLPEQAAMYAVEKETYEAEYSYGRCEYKDEHTSCVPLLSRDDIDGFLVKDGILIGVRRNEEYLLAGQYFDCAEGSDEDGPGSRSWSESSRLVVHVIA